MEGVHRTAAGRRAAQGPAQEHNRSDSDSERDPYSDDDRRAGDSGDGAPSPSGKGTGSRRGASGGSVHPSLLSLALLWTVVTVALFVHWRTTVLPAPLPLRAPATSFSEVRARKQLAALVGGIGHRPVGSTANEVEAVAVILGALRDMEAAAQRNGWRLEIETQHPSGSVSFSFLYSWFTNAYSNITNVLVRLSRADTPVSSPLMDRALLVSAHYDSTLGTPGASDDAVGIVVMLEALRAIISTPAASAPPAAASVMAAGHLGGGGGGAGDSAAAPPPFVGHPVVWNFNGAEESFLQASHGFITMHPWARAVRAFVNLEAAGVGGPEILFQTGPHNAWLAAVYAAAAPHPHGTVVGQDIFQRGLIPGDTDFRIYRDFTAGSGHSDGQAAGAPGFDMAFFHGGDLYHTHLDSPERIPPGSIQHMGDNVLALVTAVASHPLLGVRAGSVASDGDPAAHQEAEADAAAGSRGGSAVLERAVYFDVFRLTMAAYTGSQALLVSAATAGVAAALLLSGAVRVPTAPGTVPSLGAAAAMVAFGALEAVVQLVAGIFAAVGAALVVTLVLDAHMAWYANTWLLPLLYGASAASGALWVLDVVARRMSRGLSRRQRQARATLGLAALWLAAHGAMMWAGLGSAYLAVPYALCPLLGLAAGEWVAARTAYGEGAVEWTVTLAVGVLVPAAHGLYLSQALTALVVPVLGKAGALPGVVADLVVAGATAVMAFLSGGVAMPALHRFKSGDGRSMRRAVALLVVVGLGVASVVPPYSADHPKRLIIYHLHRLPHVDLARHPTPQSRDPLCAETVQAEGAPSPSSSLKSCTAVASSIMVSAFDPFPARKLNAAVQQQAAVLRAGAAQALEARVAAGATASLALRAKAEQLGAVAAMDVPEPVTLAAGDVWLSWFPFSNFLRGHEFGPVPRHPAFAVATASAGDAAVTESEMPAPHGPPTVEVSGNEVFEPPARREDHDWPVRRRVTLTVDTRVNMWATVNISAHGMVGWSLSQHLPELTCEDGVTRHFHDVRRAGTTGAASASAFQPHEHHAACSYVVRHAGGPGSERWTFWLDLTDDSPVRVALGTMWVHPHVASGRGEPQSRVVEEARDAGVMGGGVQGAWATTAGMGASIKSFVAAVPTWVSPTIAAGSLQTHELSF